MHRIHTAAQRLTRRGRYRRLYRCTPYRLSRVHCKTSSICIATPSVDTISGNRSSGSSSIKAKRNTCCSNKNKGNQIISNNSHCCNTTSSSNTCNYSNSNMSSDTSSSTIATIKSNYRSTIVSNKLRAYGNHVIIIIIHNHDNPDNNNNNSHNNNNNHNNNNDKKFISRTDNTMGLIRVGIRTKVKPEQEQ